VTQRTLIHTLNDVDAVVIYVHIHSFQFQIRIFWKRLAWPDLEVAFTFAANIINVSTAVLIAFRTKSFPKYWYKLD